MRCSRSLGVSSPTLKYLFLVSKSSMPLTYSRPCHAGKCSGEDLKFLHILHSIKASRGIVCLVEITSAPTRPMVDAHASNASLWVRVGVRVRALHGVCHWVGECKCEQCY